MSCMKPLKHAFSVLQCLISPLILPFHAPFSLFCSFLSSDIDDYKDVLSEVTGVRSEAEKLGIALGLSAGSFDPNLDVVIKDWLNQNYDTQRHGLPSYQQLVKAVASKVGPGNPALARKIATKHPSELDGHSDI